MSFQRLDETWSYGIQSEMRFLSDRLFQRLALWGFSLGNLVRFLSLRGYFSRLFHWKGMVPAVVLEDRSVLAVPDRPVLILGYRVHRFQSLFVFLQFMYPLIVPIDRGLFSGKLGRLLKKVSYEDAGLSYTLPSVSSLISSGYSTLAYINDGFVNVLHSHDMALDVALMDVLKLDCDIYVLKLDGFEQFGFHPFLIRRLFLFRW